MTILTEKEIMLRHRGCTATSCLICGGDNFADILSAVKNVGLTIETFSYGSYYDFPFVVVKEDELTCSQKLNPNFSCISAAITHADSIED